MGLETPIRDIVPLDEVFENFGITFKGNKLEFEGDPHDYSINSRLLKSMVQGRTTVADFLGKREHDKPIIEQSYTHGVSVEDMVAGLIRLGIGYPWSNPDYAILPVLYAINKDGIPTKDDYVEHEGVFRPRNLISIDSCVGHARVVPYAEYEEEMHHARHGHGHEHSDPGYEPSGSSGYAVMPKLATLHEGFVTLAYRLDDDTKIAERAIAALERAFRRHDVLETMTSVHHGRETVTVRSKAWERLSPRYPIHAEQQDVPTVAIPIMTAVYKTWSAIILAVNEANHIAGRDDLTIDFNLVHSIKDYALNSRHNALMTTNHFRDEHGGYNDHGNHGHH